MFACLATCVPVTRAADGLAGVPIFMSAIVNRKFAAVPSHLPAPPQSRLAGTSEGRRPPAHAWYYGTFVPLAAPRARTDIPLVRCTLGTCPDCPAHVALGLLVPRSNQDHTPLTYHRTWETGVGGGNEGRRIQPFILFPVIDIPPLLSPLQSIPGARLARLHLRSQ